MNEAPRNPPPVVDRRPMISIDEQIDEIGRQLRRLEKFPGRLKPETVERKIACLSAAERSLRTIKKHADGLRVLIPFLAGMRERGVEWEEPSPALADVLLTHPTVRDVVDHFPTAVLSASRPISAIERAAYMAAPLPNPDTDDNDSDE